MLLRSWSAWALLASFYGLHYFFRVTPSMLSPYLNEEFHINIAQMGMLYSCFFIPYVLNQLPAGYCLERFQNRWVGCFSCLMAAVGCYLFASSGSLIHFCMAFAIYALACSSSFVGAIDFASKTLPPQQQALAIGLTQMLGMIGGFAAKTFLPSQITPQTPWPILVNKIGFGLFILGILIALVVPSISKNMNQAELNKIHRDHPKLDLWVNALYAGLIYLPMQLFAEALGEQLLAPIHQLSSHDVSWAISFAFIGWMIGSPGCSLLTKFVSLNAIMKGSAYAGVFFIGIFLFTDLNLPMLALSLFLFGLTNAGLIACFTKAAQFGSIGLAVTNMMNILVGAVLIPVLSALLSWSVHTFTDLEISLIYKLVASLSLLAPMLAWCCVRFLEIDEHTNDK